MTTPQATPISTRTIRSALVLAGAAVLAVPLFGASHAGPTVEAGGYSGSADAAVVELDVVEASGVFTLVAAQLAPTSAGADSAGTLSFGGEDGLTAFGDASNAGASLADELLLDGLLVRATQTAPPDNTEPTTEVLLAVPGAPLLETEVATAEALARDAGTVCAATEIAYGTSEVADARLFPDALDPGTHVVHLDEVVDATSNVSLVDNAGQDTLAVQAQATSSVESLELFGEVDVRVASPPQLTATATGIPGTASVEYTAPAVTINGEGLDFGETIEIAIPPGGDPAIVLRIALGDLTESVSADGTQASGEATLINVTVLSAPDMGTLAELAVAPMSVEAIAPDGGVDCAAFADDGVDADGVDADGVDADADGADADADADADGVDADADGVDADGVDADADGVDADADADGVDADGADADADADADGVDADADADADADGVDADGVDADDGPFRPIGRDLPRTGGPAALLALVLLGTAALIRRRPSS